MTVKFHDPRGDSRVPAEPYECSNSLEGKTVLGLLANGFPDSVAFMDTLEGTLTSMLPLATFIRYEKSGPSAPADSGLMGKIVSECDALITAYGH